VEYYVFIKQNLFFKNPQQKSSWADEDIHKFVEEEKHI
jgi:hypothetical protein